MASVPKTSIYFDVKDFLDDQFARLDREKITRWLMCFSANVAFDIEDCRGGRIQYEGIQFEGSPRDVFWSFIHPCVEMVIAEAFRRAMAKGSALAPKMLHRALDETGELAKQFVARIFNLMVLVDHRLINMGKAQKLPPYDASQFINALNEAIDLRATSLKAEIPIGIKNVIVGISKDPKQLVSLLGIGSIISAAVIALFGLVYRQIFGG